MKCLNFGIIAGLNAAIALQFGIYPVQAQSPPPAPSAPLPTLQPSVQPKTSVVEAPATPSAADLTPNPNRLQLPTETNQVEVQKTVAITLKQAIETAQRNSLTLQVAQAQLRRSQAALREAEAALYPTFSFQASLSRDLSASGDIAVQATERQTRQQITQGEAALRDLLASPSPTDPLSAFLQRNSLLQTQAQLAQGQASLDALKNYGTTSFNGSFLLEYALYTGGQRPALIQVFAEQVRQNQLEVERILEQLQLDITNAYYDVQSANEQVRIETAAVTEATRSLDNTEALSKNGLATRLDVLNTQVQLDNASQQLVVAQTQQQVSRRRLSRLLNSSATITVTAAEPVKLAEPWTLSLEESIVQALKKRVELQQQLAQRNVSINQRKAAEAALRPLVGVFANYNVLALGNDAPGEGISRGWGDGYSVGMRVQWRLYDGGAARARAAQETENIAIAETRFAETGQQIRLDVEQSYFNLQSNLKNVQTATASLNRAREALRAARVRFGAGVGLQNDVLDAESRLTQAEGNLIQATLGYNRALAALKRAVSWVGSSPNGQS
ncbi:TolC family protein [Leptolyngbya sp. FACHB-17]|uniref:TolC family protein n=1 Tax=unclassified Leptolyngbya TaxID=2650499 RepID=UPI0016818920|nr:TolC family protein [Leptolyngbya sp. FACHB-17]MBD2078593.1 TolC family protein [Leptolyngbya sp. FACHB-17]